MQKISYTFLLFLTLLIQPVYAQNNTEVFGQNRVQTRSYTWKFFETEHFRIYHYDAAGRQLARYVAEQAERNAKELENKMGESFPHQFNIFLYNGFDEYQETNVGRKYDTQLQDLPAGKVTLIGDKLVVYFTGIHTDLEAQIKEGMAKVMMERLLNGDNFRKKAKNSVVQNLPSWVLDGYFSFVVNGWSSTKENEWKCLVEATPYQKFYALAENHGEIAGLAFWKYIQDRYGVEMARALVYMVQINTNLNKTLKEVIGLNELKVYADCMAYFRNQFEKDNEHRDTLNFADAILKVKSPNDQSVIRSFKVSPRSKDVAYVVWKNAEYQVYLQHTEGSEVRNTLLLGGIKDYNDQTADPNYPLMSWSNMGNKLAVLYKDRGHLRLKIYNSFRAKIENYGIPNNRFDRALSMTFNDDDNFLVFSAIKKSQTDLFSFIFKGSKLINITNDLWDDVEPTYINGGIKRGILFLSNRNKNNLVAPLALNELPTGPMNVYFYDTKTKSPILLKCSSIQSGHLSQPIQFGPDNFAFLYDKNGIYNKYVVVFGRDKNNQDSAYAVPTTDYAYSIIAHQYNSIDNKVAEVVRKGNDYYVFTKPLEIPQLNQIKPEPRPTVLASVLPKSINTSLIDDKQINQNNGNSVNDSLESTLNAPYSVKPLFKKHTSNSDTDLLLNPIIKDSSYLKLKAQPYRYSFKPDFLALKLNNNILFSNYQPVAFSGTQYTNPTLGGLLTINLYDALENQRLTGGIRLPIPGQGNTRTYFLEYENYTHRADWGVVFLKNDDYYNYNVLYFDTSGNYLVKSVIGKNSTHLLQGHVTYPFNHIKRMGLYAGIRQDVLTFKAEDALSLSLLPTEKQYWGMSRVEYVFDNSTSPILNIRYGARYKVFGEYLLGMSKSNNGGFYNFGVDYRQYIKLYKKNILAIRLAGAHSAGNQHILYSLGGVDNCLNATTNIYTPVNSHQDYAFTALATSMRGYKQNARNGNTYAVGNFELRCPILTTLVKRPIHSALLRYLQLIAFTDIGSAWDGLIPDYYSKTKLYTLNTPPNPVWFNVDVPYSNNMAVGYGAGLRTMLLGYFMRLDAAWNYETKPNPLFYFSIGTDF